MTDIDAIRRKENEKMISHYKDILDIINTKCERCESYYGCLGCVFSCGEMIYHLKKCLQLMEQQDKEACMKIFNMSEDKWDSFIKTE